MKLVIAILLALGSVALAQEPADINKAVQEKLRQLGFYDGPINGDIGPNTQAALAQFQLSVPIPASGQLDDLTLGALGIQRQAPQATAERATEASAGATK